MSSILVIDSNPDKIKYLEQRLMKKYPDSKIVFYTDPLLAFQYVYNYKVNAIYTAVHMRRLNGLEFAKMVKEISPFTQVYFTEPNWDKREEIRYHVCTMLCQRISIYPGQADEAVGWMRTEEDRKQLEGELAFLRGDFKSVMKIYENTAMEQKTKLCAMNLAINASIAMGDLEKMIQIMGKMEEMESIFTEDETVAMILRISVQTTQAKYQAAEKILEFPNLAVFPDDIKKVVFLQHGLYYMQCRNYQRSIGILETALAFGTDNRYAPSDLNLYLLCGQAYFEIGNFGKARIYADKAVLLGMEDGFIVPYIFYITNYGMILENCIRERYPGMYDKVMEQCEVAWKNPLRVHNIFADQKVNTLLTRKEYQIAKLAANGYTNKEIAVLLSCSVAFVKRYLGNVFDKLLISKRKELYPFIL